MKQDSARSFSSARYDVLDPLVAVLWADRSMSAAQVRALDTIAKLLGVENLASRIVSRVSKRSAHGIPPLGWRPAVYAMAVWVAAVDGRIERREAALLSRFAQLWQVAPDLQVRLNRLASSLASVAKGRPTESQLLALVRASLHLANAPEDAEFAA